MKSKLLFMVMFVTWHTFSQNGIVNYGFIKSLSIGNAIGDDYNARLYFNNEKALYVTAKIDLETQEKIHQEKVYKSPDGRKGEITSGLVVSVSGDQVLTDRKNGEIKSNFLFGKHIYVKDKLIEVSWNITKEEKKIGNYTCKKAIGNYRGRDYTAWYCPALPIAYGPWKLNGLPGLILEAYDTNKHVYWYFKNIEYGSKVQLEEKNLELLDNNGAKQEKFMTYQEYLKHLDKEIEEMMDQNAVIEYQNNVTYATSKKSTLFIEFVE